jgi:uncharacterized coiled-coil DUF342 family protein
MSCGAPTNIDNEQSNNRDIFIESLDSMLLYADEELEHIRHDNDEEKKEHERMVNRINTLSHKMDEITFKLAECFIENSNVIELSDSLSNVIETQKSTDRLKSNQIEKLNRKIEDINLKHRKEILIYGYKEQVLMDSISTLNDSINNLKTFILNNVKQSKIGDYLIIEE